MRLSTDDGALILSGGKWCEVLARFRDASETSLGSDALEVVVARLSQMLVAESLDTSAGQLLGTPVAWVTSFSEHHGSLYAADDGEVRRLIVQSAAGAVLGELLLTREDRRRWQSQLEAADWDKG